MPDWYEVYDDEQVQLHIRRRVGRLVIALVLGASAGVAMAPLLALYLPSAGLAVAAVALGLAAFVGAVVRAMLRLRCVVWCIKLSPHRAVGYDYARRKTVMAWPDVERVEVDGEGLLLVETPRAGRAARALRIPDLFPDYARLSHRVVAFAEAHAVPICIEGRPWQLLDVAVLYPFLPACAIARAAAQPERSGDPLDTEGDS